jgi:hypothetical protein
MTEVTHKQNPAPASTRDWLAELNTAVADKDEGEAQNLIVAIRTTAPELKAAAIEAIGRLRPELAEWARTVFVERPKPKPRPRPDGVPKFIRRPITSDSTVEPKADSATRLESASASSTASPTIVPDEEIEPEAATESAEAEPEPYEEIEDDTNAANDTRRRLWRLQSALEHIDATGIWIPIVGSILWRMSRDDRRQGEQIWMEWLGVEDKDRARKLWDAGFGESKWYPVEVIWHEAQKQGWRFPVAQNLNRLEVMVATTERALIRAGADIYQRGKHLVRPIQVRLPAAAPAGSKEERTTTVTTTEAIPEAWLTSKLTRYVDFFKWNKADKREGIGPPKPVVQAMLSRYGLWEFPVLRGIITAPTLRPDGSLLATEGYDPQTGLLLMGPVPRMPALADEPSKDDARKAIAILDAGLLSEFPFVDRGSKSVALSGLITPTVRGALKCVPGHSATAPESGTGKSLLWDLVAAILSGDAMPIIATGPKDELDKRIDAQVLSGISMWSFDNVSVPIGGDALCQVIERPLYLARVLSKSETRSFRNVFTIYITGNALKIKNDATRRILRAAMDAKQEKPEHRLFKGDPYNDILRDRGKYIWAALTVVRSYIVAGQPGKLRSVSEPFGAWSDLVRSALVWLDYEDPYITTEATREHDPDRQARAAVLQAILLAYGDDPKPAIEMIDEIKGEFKVRDEIKTLKAAIEVYLNGRKDAQYLGNKFSKDRGRITDGLKLCAKYDSTSKVNHWYVEKVNAAIGE